MCAIEDARELHRARVKRDALKKMLEGEKRRTERIGLCNEITRMNEKNFTLEKRLGLEHQKEPAGD